jgi:hypothetical protein
MSLLKWTTKSISHLHTALQPHGPVLGLEALHRARQVEMKMRPTLGRHRVQAGEAPTAVHHVVGFDDRVGDAAPPSAVDR